MTNKSIWIYFNSIILALIGFFYCSTSFSGITEEIDHDKMKIGFNVSYASHNRIEMLEVISSPYILNQANPNTTGLHITNNFDTYALGSFLWIPLTRMDDIKFHGVFWFDHMPGSNLSAHGGTILTPPNASNQAFGYVKSHRTNFAAGLSATKPLLSDLFIQAQLTGGASRLRVRGETFSLNSDTGSLSVDGDHPGLVSTTPFVQGQLGLGKQLSSHAHALLFVNYSLTRRDKPITLTGHGSSTSRISLSPPKHWYQFGAAFIRDIRL